MAKPSEPKLQKKKGEVSVREGAELEREITREERRSRDRQGEAERGEQDAPAETEPESEEDESDRPITRVAVLLDEMFDEAEFRGTHQSLRGAGHDVIVIGRVAQARLTGSAGQAAVTTDFAVREVLPPEFDALVIPGGFSPDHLRGDSAMVDFARSLLEAGKPVAAIGRGPLILIEQGLAEGRTVTSWPSLEADLSNAGARWTDREVVEDGNLITSRGAQDLPAFCAAVLRQLSEGVPERGTPPLAPEATASVPPRP